MRLAKKTQANPHSNQQWGTNMTVSSKIYFLGNYRPAHFEADTFHGCANLMLRAIANVSDANLQSWLRDHIYSGLATMDRDANTESVSADHCNKGVGYARRPHDPWLDSTTAKIRPCPGLDYSLAINGDWYRGTI